MLNLKIIFIFSETFLFASRKIVTCKHGLSQCWK